MNKYRVIVSYDGFAFRGWQNQTGLRTVQGVLEKALSVITKKKVEVVGSGRTDAKVHALGQVFHYETEVQMPCANWKDAMNSLLPDDVHIMSVESVATEFHARFHATSKYYQYHINVGEINIFQRDHVLQYCKPLDIEMMKMAAKIFEGTHDFTSLNATELAIISNQIRHLDRFDLEVNGDHLIVHVCGSGFLRYMVRMLVALLIEVGKGKLSLRDCERILEAQDKNSFTKNIGPEGLYLVQVFYPDEWL